MTQKVNSLDMQLRWIYLYDKLATNKIHEVKTINKDRSNQSESTRRHGCISEFLLFRGVRLVGGVWVSNSRCHKRPHPILRWTSHKSSVHLPLLISLLAEIESRTTILRHNPQKDWELPSGHKRPQPPQKASRVQRPKRNKLTNFHFHESSWRAQTDAQCNGKSTTAQILHSQIPPKATNAYGGRREEELRRTQQINSKI